MTAYKIQATQKAKEQQDLLAFTKWLNRNGLYDLLATMAAASDIEPQPGPSKQSRLQVVHRR